MVPQLNVRNSPLIFLLIFLSCFNKYKLQSIQNTLARIVTNHRKYVYITPILKQLRWQSVNYFCTFKTVTLVYKFLNRGSTSYFGPSLSLSSYSYSTGRIHSDHKYLTLPPLHFSLYKSVKVFGQSLLLMFPRFGMIFLVMYSVQHLLPPSGKSSKLTCLQNPIHHSLHVNSVSSWYDLAMLLDLQLFTLVLFS